MVSQCLPQCSTWGSDENVTDEATSRSSTNESLGDTVDRAERAAAENAAASTTTTTANTQGNYLQQAELLRGGVPSAPSPSSAPRTLIPHKHDACPKKLCVVLDLDETLVRFREGPIHWRPHFEEFLDAIKHSCEVVLWTASTEKCAARIMDTLDPHGDRIHHHVYRNELWFTGVPYTKDLRLLNRNMDEVIIVENTPQCVFSNPRNAIIVEDYIEPNHEDRSLELVKDLVLDMEREGEVNVPAHLYHSHLTDNVTGVDADGNLMLFHLPSYVLFFGCDLRESGTSL